ncbi:MAG: hypothetical protein ACRCYK_04380 [Aeromonas hydrophila]
MQTVSCNAVMIELNHLKYLLYHTQSQTVVLGGLWNGRSAVKKADFISALASHYSFDFLALTETWISPQNTATPAALVVSKKKSPTQFLG